MQHTFWGLTVLDLSVIVAYFVAIIVIAIRAARLVKSRDDFFMAGRRFGKLIQSFAAFGQSTSVENVTTTMTMVNANGAAGIWAMLAGGLVNLPIFWMTSLWYRRLRILTLGDFFEERYRSKRMAAFYALCQAFYFLLVGALGLTAMAKTVAAIAAKQEAALTPIERVEYGRALEAEKLAKTDFVLLTPAEQTRLKELQLQKPKKEYSYINENVLIVVVATVTLAYASIGGLAAAFLVDLVQGIFTILLSLILVPFAMIKINRVHGTHGFLGAFQVMHHVLPASFLELWGSPSLIEFSWYWIAAFSVLVLITVAVQANQFTACGSAKDDHTARYGFVSGVMLKRYLTVVWGFVALLTVILYGGSISDPDYVWGLATRDLLGPVGIGLVGVMVASLMAALMAAKSAFMLTASGLLTNNLYRPLVPHRSENHYIWAGRVFSALYMGAAAALAMQFKDVFEIFKMTMLFNCILGASFWLGMLWRRSNCAGAWVSMLVMFVATVILPFGLPLIPGLRTAPSLLKTTEAVPVSRMYVAREMDVQERLQATAHWDLLRAAGKTAAARPLPLIAGQKFAKTVLLPPKAVFWSEGLQFDGGKPRGEGTLQVELVALDRLGWDLTKNTYSLNETLTFLFRIIVPFAVLMLVAVFTQPEPKEPLDQFYGKMLTPVVGSHEDDAQAMALTRANPHRFDHLKMFPGSAWEMRRWNREDWGGVVGSCLVGAGVVVLLLVVVTLGGG